MSGCTNLLAAQRHISRMFPLCVTMWSGQLLPHRGLRIRFLPLHLVDRRAS